MIRRFNFEDEVHHSLACVPMAVRRKLDRVGVKVSLEQWQALAQYERLAICHLPTDSDEERETVRTFLDETVKARSGTLTKAFLTVGVGTNATLGQRYLLDLSYRYGHIFPRTGEIANDQGINTQRLQAGIGIRF